MKFGVVIFPGSNCDQDMIHVCREVMQAETRILWHKDTSLQDLTTDDCIMIPGGFSYGDYLRCGAIARFSPIMEKVIEHANNGGYVWGVCNGFQILCESHLLPGALLQNQHQSFICQNQYLLPISNNSMITRGLDMEHPLNIPIAHGEGRFYAAPEVLEDMKRNDQILFKYCDTSGAVNDVANPNGSLENIAGICNKNRNVFGMMPHPERASEEVLNNTDGRRLFESMLHLSLAQ
jgi:phosphoribosylformylglycinamidine synthase